MTKEEITKRNYESFVANYPDGDFLDFEDKEMQRGLSLVIYPAMQEYADQETSALRAENERMRGLLEDRVRSHAYGVVCRRIDVVMNGGPTDELLKKECDKAWNFYKTENNL